MSILDMVKMEAGPDTLAWRHPSEDLSTWTQLVVMETQEAMLVKEGVMIGPFGPGRHVLDTRNFPIIGELFKIPFGGRSPFTAEVWFVNKAMNLDIKWGTPEPIQLKDPEYQIMVPVRANGQLGLQVGDSKAFLTKFVGTLPSFEKTQLMNYLRGLILSTVTDTIAKVVIKEKISVLEIAASIGTIGDRLTDVFRARMAEFGLNLINAFVNSINVPEDDPAVSRLKEALAKKAEMSIIGYNYQQERSFDVMGEAAGNPSSGSAGFMGAGMGLGMGVGIGGAMGQAMGQMAGTINTGAYVPCPACHTMNAAGARFCSVCGGSLAAPAPASAPAASPTITCSACGKPMPRGIKFCPECGDPVIPCPNCGADNAAGASVCSGCGKPLPSACPFCKASIEGKPKFCPECGKSLVQRCASCQAELPAGVRFCPECGKPVVKE